MATKRSGGGSSPRPTEPPPQGGVGQNPETVKKQKAGRAKWWNNLTEEERCRRITIFQNAPEHGVRKGPTNLERRLIDLNIEDLRFTGDGKFWLTSQKKRMNPDFKIKNQRKVVEVGDTVYWHTIEDTQDRIQKFKDINFECLYLTDKILNRVTDTELIKILKEFING